MDTCNEYIDKIMHFNEFMTNIIGHKPTEIVGIAYCCMILVAIP